MEFRQLPIDSLACGAKPFGKRVATPAGIGLPRHAFPPAGDELLQLAREVRKRFEPGIRAPERVKRMGDRSLNAELWRVPRAGALHRRVQMGLEPSIAEN